MASRFTNDDGADLERPLIDEQPEETTEVSSARKRWLRDAQADMHWCDAAALHMLGDLNDGPNGCLQVDAHISDPVPHCRQHHLQPFGANISPGGSCGPLTACQVRTACIWSLPG